MRPQPLIAVRDVEASSRWYQHLLGCESAHGGREYERLTHNGDLVLQLHDWTAHGHPEFGDPTALCRGNGVLLWFEMEQFDAAVARMRTLEPVILKGPEINPRANQRECWLKDPDGYVVVLASGYGDVG
jgi:catechol 2,3-dioxygenase-like lactoylglutathione lyase family enzyme